MDILAGMSNAPYNQKFVLERPCYTMSAELEAAGVAVKFILSLTV